MSKYTEFEEAFRVEKIDENTYLGVNPLRKPMKLARGVYGGHTCAQTLLVAMESAPGFVPNSLHSYFIGPGDDTVRTEYKVTKLHDGNNYASRSIQVIQKGKIRYTCMVSLARKRTEEEKAKVSKENDGQGELSFQRPPPTAVAKYPDPLKLRSMDHTSFITTAYTDDFVNPSLVPEEKNQEPHERVMTFYHKLNQKELFRDPRYNYIGLADITDSGFLTTLARVLHMPWNPTTSMANMDYDEGRDALLALDVSVNILHISHYNAMSLDHHIYFHSDDIMDSLDICHHWITFATQFKRYNNNRALVKGHIYNDKGENIATVYQEGLLIFHEGVSDIAKI